MAVQASPTEDDSFDSTLASCYDFAGKFMNTCDHLAAAVPFDDVPTETLTYDITSMGYDACPANGSVSGNICTWTRMLCVTCTETDGQVRIRVQTDGIPDHMTWSEKIPEIASANIDYEVDWLKDLPPNDESLSQRQIDSLICNINRSADRNIPEDVNFDNINDSKFDTTWGVSTNGVRIYNGLSGELVDPFYPANYGRLWWVEEAFYGIDSCLGHPGPKADYHYHVQTPCLPEKETYEGKIDTGLNLEDTLTIMRAGHQSWPYRTVIGVSKDGRPIYSPYYNNMQEADSCDVDVCNGMMIDGHYSYQSTFFHPYFMGCYGPGAQSDYAQACSRNPRTCGDKAVVNMKNPQRGFDNWLHDLTSGEYEFFKILFKFFAYLQEPSIHHALEDLEQED